MTPEGWNSRTRGDVQWYAMAQKIRFSAKDTYTTIKELLELVFSMWSVLRLYNEPNCL
jgi:hypothetical protein